MEIRFDDNAFIDFNREEIQVLSNELDIMKATIRLHLLFRINMMSGILMFPGTRRTTDIIYGRII
jgi:hypothetical protein